jgi:hypothetical protein
MTDGLRVLAPVAKYREQTVEALKEALDRAEAGEFTSVLLVADIAGTSEFTIVVTGSPNVAGLLGKMRVLEHEVLRAWDGEDE